MKRYILITLLLWIGQVSAQVLPNLGGQRAGLSALSFLKNDINPRSVAMAGASVAVKSKGFSTYSNPAYVADVRNFNLTTSNYFVGAGVNQSFFSAIYPFKDGGSSVGLSINALSSGAMKVRTEFQPDGTGQEVYANTIGSALTYSKRLSDMFTMGISLRHIYESLAEYNNHTVTADLGFAYQTDWKDLSFAVMLQNFGGNSSLNGKFLQVDFNRDPQNIPLDNYTVPTLFKLGASLIPYKRKDHSLLLSFDLNHPNDNAENFRLGTEFEYLKLLFLRAGYKFNVKGQNWPSFGLGVRHRIGGHPLMLDYAVNPTNYLGVQHVVGISFTFNKMER